MKEPCLVWPLVSFLFISFGAPDFGLGFTKPNIPSAGTLNGEGAEEFSLHSKFLLALLLHVLHHTVDHLIHLIKKSGEIFLSCVFFTVYKTGEWRIKCNGIGLHRVM